jgi:signal transduction histidine kinase
MRKQARLSRLFVYLLGILAALALTVVLIYFVMHPPMGDLLQLGLLLAVTSFVSAILGFISYRLGWWKRVRSLTVALTLGYVLAALLTLVNVWLTARLMFINQHDLALATLLLLFASGISVLFGYFLSGSLTQTLRDLDGAAGQLREGDFSARVVVTGENEVARLARSFNDMAARLQQAQEAERSLEEARRNLVAWASHDLRTPLAALRALIDALADGVVQDPETVARYLALCQHEIGRMSSLIDDLFELAKIDAGRMEIFCENSSLLDLVSDTLEGFSLRAETRGVALKGSVSPRVDPVWMAPEKISRVLHNLLENAIRHTPPGGRVNLVADLMGRDVLVVVEDTGAGIPADDLDHVFDRFFRGEESRAREGPEEGGAGLGLAIAKGLVEAHGGRIWAESPQGTGAKFSFILPKSSPAV